MKKIFTLFILFFIVISFNLFSQSGLHTINDSIRYNTKDTSQIKKDSIQYINSFICRTAGIQIIYSRVNLTIPIIDAPFNYQHNFYIPSMNQSLQWSASFNKIALYGIDTGIDKAINPTKKFWNHFIKGFSYLGFGLLSSYVPLGSSWLHEEYHRAIMHNRNVKSFNDIYTFPFFASTVAVSHVTDQDLIRMKNNYNSDFVRMQAAGMEGEYELVLELQKNNFFSYKPTDYQLIYWLNILQPILYINTCTTTEGDDLTDEMNKKDGTNVEKRDFTGLDFTGWTYDLFRANQPYESRGIHPSGVGINRYIKYSDLTNEEQNYLRQQRNLSFLSLIDLTLFTSRNINFKLGYERIKFNFNIKHYLTSFGSSTNLNIFIKTYRKNLFVSILSQFNHQSYFPGIDISLQGHRIGYTNFYIWPRIMLWTQPKNQSFETSKHEFGGLIGFTTSYHLYKNLGMYGTIEAKTQGWVASNPFLDKNISGRIGISYNLFYKTIQK